MSRREISRRDFILAAGAGSVLAGATIVRACEDTSAPPDRPGHLLFSDDFSSLRWDTDWLNLRYATPVQRSSGMVNIAFPPANHLAVDRNRPDSFYLHHPIIVPDFQISELTVSARVQLRGLIEAGVIACASFDEAYALLIGGGRALLCRYSAVNRRVFIERSLRQDQPADLQLTVGEGQIRGVIVMEGEDIELVARDDKPRPAGFVGVVANALDESAPATARFGSFRVRSNRESQDREEEFLYAFTGAVVADGAAVRVRVTARTVIARPISFQLSTRQDFQGAHTTRARSSRGDLGSVHAWFNNLDRGKTYYWRPLVKSGTRIVMGPTTTFRTPPGRGGGARFVFASCTSGRRDHYRSLQVAADLDVDFFLHAGDWGYADQTAVVDKPDHFQARWIRLMRTDEGRRLLSRTPLMFWQDDHDYQATNCWSRTCKPYAVRAFDELHANPTDEYFDVRWGDLHVWCLDCRLYATDPDGPDDASKSLLGRRQKAWLKRGMSQSDAPVKVVASPMVFRNKIPKDPGWHSNYTTERDELLSFFSSLDSVVLVLSGDAHGQRLIHHHEFGDLYEFNCSGTDFHPGVVEQGNYDPDHTELFFQSNGIALVELHPAGPKRDVRITVIEPTSERHLYERSFSVT